MWVVFLFGVCDGLRDGRGGFDDVDDDSGVEGVYERGMDEERERG